MAQRLSQKPSDHVSKWNGNSLYTREHCKDKIRLGFCVSVLLD